MSDIDFDKYVVDWPERLDSWLDSNGSPHSGRILHGIPTSSSGVDGQTLNGFAVRFRNWPPKVNRVTFEAHFHQGAKDPIHGGGGSQAGEMMYVEFNSLQPIPSIVWQSGPWNGSTIDLKSGTQELINWDKNRPFDLFSYATELGHWPINLANYPQDGLTVYLHVI